MQEPFSESARRAIVVAQEESTKLGHACLGTEHLLLGIIQDEGSSASRALQARGLDLKTISARIEKEKGRGGGPEGQEMAFSPHAKRVVELAFEEAQHLNHRFIGTDHLFLGILRVDDSAASSIISQAVNDVPTLRNEVIAALRQEVPTVRSARATSRHKRYEIRLVVVETERLDNAETAIQAHGRHGFSVVAATALTPKTVLAILQREI